MPAQEKLNRDDQIVAYVVGAGIAIIIIALILIGLGTVDDDDGITFGLLPGLALIILGVGYWLIQVRPWEKFDDLQTPHFAGQEEHAVAEPVAEAPAVEAVEEAVEAAIEEAPAEKVVKAVKAEAAPEPDDLTLIEGVGPKSAAALQDAGIATFAQVAQETPDALEKAIKDRKVRLVGSTETWPRQAELAAAGDLTALEAFQERIKGGVVAEDDLTLIEGIGPKSAAALQDAGIATFAQVAKMTPDALEKAIKDRKVRLVGSTETWPRQAELADAGDLTALEAFQERIKGGVVQDDD